MDFQLSPDQKLLRDTVREFAEAEIAPVVAEYESQAKFPRPIVHRLWQELGLGGKKLFMPVRAALTGAAHGPDLDRLYLLMGPDRAVARLRRASSIQPRNSCRRPGCGRPIRPAPNANRANICSLSRQEITTPADLAVIDVSFTSLKKIWPPVIALLKPDGALLSLVKPQLRQKKRRWRQKVW